MIASLARGMLTVFLRVGQGTETGAQWDMASLKPDGTRVGRTWTMRTNDAINRSSSFGSPSPKTSSSSRLVWAPMLGRGSRVVVSPNDIGPSPPCGITSTMLGPDSMSGSVAVGISGVVSTGTSGKFHDVSPVSSLK